MMYFQCYLFTTETARAQSAGGFLFEYPAQEGTMVKKQHAPATLSYQKKPFFLFAIISRKQKIRCLCVLSDSVVNKKLG
jgi:hypothetical protein